MKLLIEMTLQSDAVFGNGLSIPGGEDIATQMDDAGFPYLKLGSFLVHSKEKTERYKKQDNKKKPDSYHRYLEKMLNSDLFELLEIDGKKVMGIPADQLFEPDEQIRYKLQLMERQIRYANREGRNHG